jgi:hypothetical protein
MHNSAEQAATFRAIWFCSDRSRQASPGRSTAKAPDSSSEYAFAPVTEFCRPDPGLYHGSGAIHAFRRVSSSAASMSRSILRAVYR